MDVISTGFGIVLAVIVLVVIGLLVVISRLFRKVEQGKALIVSKVQKVDVTFTGAIVMPVFHKAEIMDISVKTIEIERTGQEGLICRDNIRADIRISFFVRVNKTVEDVIKVAQAIGTYRASDEGTLQAAVQREVLRGAQDGRQAARLRRPVHQARRVPRPDHPGDRHRPQRVQPGGRGDRLPRADADGAARPEEHPRRPGHPQDH